MNWWQYLITSYLAIFAAVFLRMSVILNHKRAELKKTRGITQDETGHPLTYLRFLPGLLGAAAQWPITVLWGGLYAFLRELM